MKEIDYKELYFIQSRVAHSMRKRLIAVESQAQELETKCDRLQEINNELIKARK